MQVENIGGPTAVDIGQADAPRVELIRVVEPRRTVHGHLGPKAAIPQIGPVADFPVAEAHQIGEAIARKIGQEYGLRSIGEH